MQITGTISIIGNYDSTLVHRIYKDQDTIKKKKTQKEITSPEKNTGKT